MATSVQDFRDRFPEFADLTEYTDSRIQMFLDDAALLMGNDENYWCDYYNVAQCYLAAHLLILGTKSEYGDLAANAGPVSGKSAGGVSVTRATAASASRSDTDDFYLSTMYGQRFVMYRDRCHVGVMVIC